MSKIRIMMGDPGRTHDPFGIVGVELDLKTFIIIPKFARHYQKMSFEKVAADMLPIVQKIKPSIFGLETNNEGKKAINEFQKQGINTKGVSTVSVLTDEHRQYWQSMDKTYTVKWVKSMIATRNIQFPSNPSPHMQALEDQISLIAEYITPNGSLSYKARNGRHDDLFMAFILCCHIARIYMDMSDEEDDGYVEDNSD